jgi:hypothetical protein
MHHRVLLATHSEEANKIEAPGKFYSVFVSTNKQVLNEMNFRPL